MNNLKEEMIIYSRRSFSSSIKVKNYGNAIELFSLNRAIKAILASAVVATVAAVAVTIVVVL